MIARFIYAFVFILVVNIPTAWAKPILDIKQVKTESGIEAWLVEDRSQPIIAMQFAFKGIGAASDPADKQGLARMISNTLDEGADDMTSQDFQKILNDMAITLRFGSNRDHLTGTLKTLSHNKGIAFEMLQKALTAPRFDQEPVDRMRAANIARIKSSLSNPQWLAARLLNDVAYGDHPYAYNSGGTLTSLQNITTDDLHNFVNTRFAKDKLSIAVVGDIGPNELAVVLDQVFAHLPETNDMKPVADQTIQSSGDVILYQHNIPQTIIMGIQNGIDKDDPDYYAADIMNFILGSSGFGTRLMAEAREKRGLTYGIYTQLQQMDHANALVVTTSTKNETVKDMLDIISTEWKKMAETPVTKEEVSLAQSYLTGSLPLQLDSTDAIAEVLLSIQLDGLPIDHLDKRQEKLNAITLKDVQRVAKRLLNPDNLTTILVGNPTNIEPTRIVDELPNVE